MSGRAKAPICPKESTPPVTLPRMPSGAALAVSASRMPCHESAVALNTQAMSPTSSVGHPVLQKARSVTLPAMPSASPAITLRGLT